MKIYKKIHLLKKNLSQKRDKKLTIGFVPTMGALHEGHLSLIRKSRRENDITVVSIFVNALQFSSKGDLMEYPRPENNDILLAQKEKIDILFYPSSEEMYPAGFLTNVNVNKITDILCGQFRLGHFSGVTTIVTKLLNIVQPDLLYLGQKDIQQAIVIQRLVKDLNMDVKIKVCSIIREKDGLALSSRNRNLTKSHRKEAIVLYKALKNIKQSGVSDVKKIKIFCREMIEKQSSGVVEYIECVDHESLEAVKILQKKNVILLAVQFGNIRLIDNIVI